MQPFTKKGVAFATIPLLLGAIVFFVIPKILSDSYVMSTDGVLTETNVIVAGESEIAELPEPKEIQQAAHIPTPEPLKAIYMTSWVAGTQTMRDHVISLADTTEVNAIVIDLKDYTGKIAYPVEDESLSHAVEKRMTSLRELTDLLHSKGIYVIGRVAVFQDPHYVKMYPQYAVKRSSDKTKVWTDRKGISWIDAGSQPIWDYSIAIAKDAYAQGVDEINFDYIRFPSDGNMKDIYFPVSEGKVKSDVLKAYWEYLYQQLSGTGIVTSADLFGMTTTVTSDMNIGQLLENALPNFDYVMPMVYPSHYPAGWNGFAKPEAYPYEVIQISMSEAKKRAEAIGVSPLKLRPWLQDFGLGMAYTSKEVRAQIQATYDVGLTSWLMWDPKTKYTAGALLKE